MRKRYCNRYTCALLTVLLLGSSTLMAACFPAAKPMAKPALHKEKQPMSATAPELKSLFLFQQHMNRGECYRVSLHRKNENWLIDAWFPAAKDVVCDQVKVSQDDIDQLTLWLHKNFPPQPAPPVRKESSDSRSLYGFVHDETRTSSEVKYQNGDVGRAIEPAVHSEILQIMRNMAGKLCTSVQKEE